MYVFHDIGCNVYKSYFQIHWFSIFNSFMMVIFLVGLVSMILMRTLRKDYARYSKEDDVDDMERDLGTVTLAPIDTVLVIMVFFTFL